MKPGNLELTYSYLDNLERAVSSAELSLFQAAQLLSLFQEELLVSVFPKVLTAYIIMVREVPWASGQFQSLPETPELFNSESHGACL